LYTIHYSWPKGPPATTVPILDTYKKGPIIDTSTIHTKGSTSNALYNNNTTSTIHTKGPPAYPNEESKWTNEESKGVRTRLHSKINNANEEKQGRIEESMYAPGLHYRKEQ
jgi:hypothetical protein